MTTAWGKLIQEHRKEILERWLDRGLSFFSERMDRTTPIGEALSLGLSTLLDGIEENGKAFTAALNDVVRLFAVQNFPPSSSMALFFELTEILRAVVTKLSGKKSLTDMEWNACRTRMEEITLQAFDCYMANREKIYQLKVDESSRRVFMALRRVEA
ncbi:MAG: hypothetical protein FDX18_00265 [Chlorobium sp.]|nr:MAG: hypothetical protein FDX18_00265 [Chlorobium sp.]